MLQKKKLKGNNQISACEQYFDNPKSLLMVENKLSVLKIPCSDFNKSLKCD